MDRLSELPDSLIHHIFSFLCMKDVVRTTILSKRWEDLWTTVPYLSFEAESGKLDKFRDFVNRTMMLWRGTKILKFRVCTMLFLDGSFYHDQNVWVRLAVKHKVEELDLFDFYPSTGGSCLPKCLFSSSSITKLSLYGCDVIFHGKIYWNQLKSLKINNFDVDQYVINNVLLGSPQLELLELWCCRNVNIYSISLKKLFLRYDAEDYYSYETTEEIDSELHIWAPNLEVLTIEGTVCNEFLVLLVPSLIKAVLTFCTPTFDFDDNLSDYEFDGDMLRVIFQSIDHVEELVVGDWFIKVLTMTEKRALPSPLLNLKSLTIDTRVGNECLAGIVNLLEISPNVVMLTIKNSFGYSDSDDDEDEDGDNEEQQLEDKWSCLLESAMPEVELSDSFLMNLRILDIWLFAYTKLFSHAKFVLKNANALEKIVIKGDELVGEIQKLLRMPGYSTNAEVVLR